MCIKIALAIVFISRKGGNTINKIAVTIRDSITIQECIAMHDILRRAVVIEKGHIIGFMKEGEEGNECTGIRAYKLLG